MCGRPHREGAYKLDPLTGKYTNFAMGPGKANYDIAADDEEKVWISQPGGNDMEDDRFDAPEKSNGWT